MGTVAEAARPTARRKETRTRVLDVAEAAILAKGFDATSIEEIVAGAEITKSGFFYHFRDKNELARALIERYIEEDRVILDGIFGRARELNDDPLHTLPDRAEALRRDDGRPAERTSRLHGGGRLLPGASVRRGGARAEPAGGAGLADAVPRAARAHRRTLSAARAGRSRGARRHGLHRRRGRHRDVEGSARAAGAAATRCCCSAPTSSCCSRPPDARSPADPLRRGGALGHHRPGRGGAGARRRRAGAHRAAAGRRGAERRTGAGGSRAAGGAAGGGRPRRAGRRADRGATARGRRLPPCRAARRRHGQLSGDRGRRRRAFRRGRRLRGAGARGHGGARAAARSGWSRRGGSWSTATCRRRCWRRSRGLAAAARLALVPASPGKAARLAAMLGGAERHALSQPAARRRRSAAAAFPTAARRPSALARPRRRRGGGDRRRGGGDAGRPRRTRSASRRRRSRPAA